LNILLRLFLVLDNDDIFNPVNILNIYYRFIYSILALQ